MKTLTAAAAEANSRFFTDCYRCAMWPDGHKATTRAWFESAKNYALYANQGGFYDDVLKHLGLIK